MSRVRTVLEWTGTVVLALVIGAIFTVGLVTLVVLFESR
jgi:hypothetical protein